MDKRITRYRSLQAMKADEYRSWQHLPGRERSREDLLAAKISAGRAQDLADVDALLAGFEAEPQVRPAASSDSVRTDLEPQAHTTGERAKFRARGFITRL